MDIKHISTEVSSYISCKRQLITVVATVCSLILFYPCQQLLADTVIDDELFLGANRSSIVGFDGANMHWLRTNGQESRLWMGFRQSGNGDPQKIRIKPETKFDKAVSIRANSAEATLHIQDIGNSAPALYLQGASASEGDIAWKNNEHLQIGRWNPASDSFTEDMRITNTGKVGIGTTDPTAELHVSGGNGSAELLIEADANNNGESDQPKITLVQDGGAVQGEFGYYGATNNLRVVNQFGGARMIFESDGDICIGNAC